jgi:hypothetical protein
MSSVQFMGGSEGVVGRGGERCGGGTWCKGVQRVGVLHAEAK